MGTLGCEDDSRVENPDSVCCLGSGAVSQACFFLESDCRIVGRRMRQLPALPSWTVSSCDPREVTLSSPSVGSGVKSVAERSAA